MEFKHISVLLDETIEELHIKPDGIYVDGTLGGGGHAYHHLDQRQLVTHSVSSFDFV